MALYKLLSASEAQPSIDSAVQGDVKSVTTSLVVTQEMIDNVVAGDEIAAVKLPADHVIVDAILDAEDIGTVYDVGVVDDEDASGQEIMVGVGPGVSRADAAGFTRVGPYKDEEKYIGMTVAGAPTVLDAVATLTVQYRAARYGV